MANTAWVMDKKILTEEPTLKLNPEHFIAK
jgi:hypothetical protein